MKQITLTETSSPLNFSSTTILLPAAPYFLSPKISSTAAQASSLLLATTTPLPAANPLALTTSASYEALFTSPNQSRNDNHKNEKTTRLNFFFAPMENCTFNSICGDIADIIA